MLAESEAGLISHCCFWQINTGRCAGSEILDEPRSEKTCLRDIRTRSDTNRAVQPQKVARGLGSRGILVSM